MRPATQMQLIQSMVNARLKAAALFIFLFLFFIGYLLSLHKPLWNDELYSQTQCIEKYSYPEILLGRLPEGNNCPLFYFTQKLWGDLWHYRFPLNWDDREVELAEKKSQIFLRVLPNFYMSLALVLLFYFLSKTLNLRAGIYALFLALATPTAWLFWAEARPYALWFLLTTAQLLLVFSIASERDISSKKFRSLTATHLLLALTSVLGALQAIAATVALAGRDKRHWPGFVFLGVIPVALGMFFFVQGPRFQFGLPAIGPVLFKNIPADRFFLIALLGVSCAIQKHLPGNKKFLLFAAMVGTFSAGLLLFYRFFQTPGDEGFVFTERHFIYLAPVGIIVTAFLVHNILKSFPRHAWVRLNIIIFIAGLLMAECIETAAALFSLNIYH